MSKQFPLEFNDFWYAAGVKKAFILDEPGIPGRKDCENCGGRGFMATFIANRGPFNHPSNSATEVSHYYDGKWWIGKTITATCPVCKGTNPELEPPEETPAQKASRPRAIADVITRKDWE